ncbi:hypothetical protein C4546_02690 [Candidatus Parcubacteria bacterium]|jgi:DNA polymerase III gamma/tau subunit|nr:MAG: hypothetical protein C4546_02690 [Candidatus Parcubacteria bacterium]
METFGQEKIQKALLRILKKSNFGHAVIFFGHDEFAAAALAEWFGQMLLCEERAQLEPCGVCQNCQNRFKTPAVVFPQLDLLSNGSGIDAVRELKSKMALKNLTDSNRVIFLKNIHNFKAAAANALLKILEEPGEKVYFVMTANSLRNVLPTISSRAMHLVVQSVPRKVMSAELAKRGLKKSDIELALELFPGQLAKAVNFFKNEANIEQIKADYRLATDLLKAPNRKRFAETERLLKKQESGTQREQVRRLLELVLIRLRQEAKYNNFLQALLKAFRDLKTNANPKQIFESLLIQLP